MIFVYSTLLFVPVAVTVAVYMLLQMIISPYTAMSIGLGAGAAVSAFMEYRGQRNHLFWIPAGGWMGLLALGTSGLVKSFGGIGNFANGHAPNGFSVAFAIIAAGFGIASVVGWFMAPSDAADDEEDTDESEDERNEYQPVQNGYQRVQTHA